MEGVGGSGEGGCLGRPPRQVQIVLFEVLIWGSSERIRRFWRLTAGRHGTTTFTLATLFLCYGSLSPKGCVGLLEGTESYTYEAKRVVLKGDYGVSAGLRLCTRTGSALCHVRGQRMFRLLDCVTAELHLAQR